MTKRLSRSDYMENSGDLHDTYYRQFVTDSTIRFIEGQIGLKRLQASEDEHLNDVCKWEKGGKTWLWDRTPINSALAGELGEGLSMSTRTCVGKAAAKMILEKAQQETAN